MSRCDTCMYQHDMEFDACHICNNEQDMYRSKPKTNYDVIQRMGLYEMAEFLNRGACPPGKDVTELCQDEDGGSVPDMCNLCWLNWLKMEVSDADN